MAESIYHPFEALDRISQGDTFAEVRDAILLPTSRQEIAEWFHLFRGAKQAFRLAGERRCEDVAEQIQDWLASKVSVVLK